MNEDTDTASPDDPNEISFAKGEILDIIDNTGKWFVASRLVLEEGEANEELLLQVAGAQGRWYERNRALKLHAASVIFCTD